MTGPGLRWARHGLVGEPYVATLQALGKTRAEAVEIAANIKREMDKGHAELWQTFTDEIHGRRRGRIIEEEFEEMKCREIQRRQAKEGVEASEPAGDTGDGRCGQRCTQGERTQDGTWKHRRAIAQESDREVQGPGGQEWKQLVPLALHRELAERVPK